LTGLRGGDYSAIKGMRTVPSKKPRDPKKPSNAVPGRAPQVRLESAGKVAVTYRATPPKGPPDKEIHPRRRLPEIPTAPSRERDRK
jgi:hypothetical protein